MLLARANTDRGSKIGNASNAIALMSLFLIKAKLTGDAAKVVAASPVIVVVIKFLRVIENWFACLYNLFLSIFLLFYIQQ
jgi:hypothetical protein